MDGHYYDDPIEDYETDDNSHYFTQEWTGSYMNETINNFYHDDLDLEYGEYMRILSLEFIIFLQNCLHQHL